MNTPRLLAWLAVFCMPLSPALADEKLDAAGVDFFEKKIRPVLVAHCYKCHSADAKSIKGGLLLDSKAGILAGGDTGPALEPGNVEDSLIIGSLRYADDAYQMPPSGKLSDEIIADFEKWVEMGAPDPRDDAGADPVKDGVDIKAGKEFWSFQKPQKQDPPKVQQADWIERPLDQFILAKLEAAKRSPAPKADKRTLLRRVYFDLIGLPPTPEEVQEFMQDESPDAYARTVDRLLASPHYGERWGRHWLDVVRYAEDNTNMGPHNGPYEHAWRYRDWVVNALNEDVPYDQFIKRQLATDLMPSTGLEDLPALGMMGLSPSNHKELLMKKLDVDRCFADDWEDRVDTIGRGLLGLTLACARCHDHKFDPIEMQDYYALAGVFASSRQTPRPLISQEEINAAEPARKQVAALEKQIEPLQKSLKQLQQEEKAKGNPAAKSQAIVEGEPPCPVITSADVQEQIAALKSKMESIKQSTPNFVTPMANALTEETTLVEKVDEQRNRLAYYPKPRDLPMYVRGDVSKPGPIVPRRFVSVLSSGEPEPFDQGSGRLELAEEIVSPENPLTARVIVNRVWMQHFGRGLVTSPSNFGMAGEAPSHPELLDYLAVTFMEQGWSLKKLHRWILLSATYQQASQVPDAHKSKDPENQLFSRFLSRRLEIEPYRDAMLAASGKLDRTLGGPSEPLAEPGFNRRTIYTEVSRHAISNLLASFDFPDPNIHCERRSTTTTPLQQLFVLNSSFMRQQAQGLYQRVQAEAGPSVAEQVTYAHLLLFARKPTTAEMEIASRFLEKAGSNSQAGYWERYLQALLSSNELLYVD